MPKDATNGAKKSNSGTAPEPQRSWFAVPTPVKQVFDRFPLTTYDANELPLRAPRNQREHALYVFTSARDARSGRPSFNPGCLKWQTYLKICNVEFTIVPSNNHASPSGSLPFLIPAASDAVPEAEAVVASSKLHKWATKHGNAPEESPDVRYEAFMSLIDHGIRRAWLYNVYLTANFESIVVPEYIHQATASPFVRLASAYELQTAAAKELRKHSANLDADAIYNDAQDALAALETLLGDDDWFFGKAEPGLFDAAVFAYTHLLLSDEAHGGNWKDTTLQELLKTKSNLVRHQQRLYELCYG